MSEPKPPEPKLIFELRVYAPRPPAMSKAIEANLIRRAMQLAAQEFGAGVGGKIAGEIVDGYNLETAEPTILGDFRYTANAPP
jgi:hypothetical protein